jgi:hypothetical protein
MFTMSPCSDCRVPTFTTRCNSCTTKKVHEATTLLHVGLGYTEAEVKDAYKRLSRLVHPDRPNGSKEEFLKLGEALEFLLPIHGRGRAVSSHVQVPDEHGDARAYAARRASDEIAAKNRMTGMMADDAKAEKAAEKEPAKAEKEQVGHAADPGEFEGEDCSLLVDLQGLILGRSSGADLNFIHRSLFVDLQGLCSGADLGWIFRGG